MMAREPDLIFVKEETYDDHPISQQLRHAGSRKSESLLKSNKCSFLNSYFDHLLIYFKSGILIVKI